MCRCCCCCRWWRGGGGDDDDDDDDSDADDKQERGGSMPVAAAAEAMHVQLPQLRRKFNEVRPHHHAHHLMPRDASRSCFLAMSLPSAMLLQGRQQGGARFYFWWKILALIPAVTGR